MPCPACSTNPSGRAPSTAVTRVHQSYRWDPAVPGGLHSHPTPQLKALARVPSRGAAALPRPQKRDAWGASSSAFTPPLLGHNLHVRNCPSFQVKSDPALPAKVTRCRGFHRQRRPWEGNRQATETPCSASAPPCRWPTWKSRPSAVGRVGDADRPNLLLSAKDKTSRKPCGWR